MNEIQKKTFVAEQGVAGAESLCKRVTNHTSLRTAELDWPYLQIPLIFLINLLERRIVLHLEHQTLGSIPSWPKYQQLLLD